MVAVGHKAIHLNRTRRDIILLALKVCISTQKEILLAPFFLNGEESFEASELLSYQRNANLFDITDARPADAQQPPPSQAGGPSGAPFYVVGQPPPDQPPPQILVGHGRTPANTQPPPQIQHPPPSTYD